MEGGGREASGPFGLGLFGSENESLEERVMLLERELLFTWTLGLGGALLAVLARRRRQVKFREVVAERFMLATPAAAAEPQVVVGDLGLRNHRPELRLAGGRVVLMDHEKNVRIQLDSQLDSVNSFREEERSTPFDEYPRLSALRSEPGLVYYDERERPAFLMAEGKVLRLRAQIQGGKGEEGDVQEVQRQEEVGTTLKE